MVAIHPTRRIHGWTVEEEQSAIDGVRTLICRRGHRLMTLTGTPDVDRETLYARGTEALISDDAHWAVRLGDRNGVKEAETRLRRHRMQVASQRLRRIAEKVQRDRELIVCGRRRRA